MTDFTQMHVFFAVTTVAVILLAAILGGVLVALWRFLRTLDRIANDVQEEAAEIRADFEELREGVKEKFRFVPWLHFFGKSGKRIARKSVSRKKAKS